MTVVLPWIIAIGLCAPPGAATDALESIESTRGGRHWIDAKTDPPKSPEESRKCFQIEPGLSIELFAAEPLVMDPVAITFDDRGRMFVVEYGDYPIGPPEGERPLSRVVLLDDTNGDGRADRRQVFADGLNFAHSLMAFNGGVLVGAQTEILFLKDTDGDDRADVREVLFRGFKPAHPQMQIGSPRWGFDNWIYWNYGPGEITPGQMTADQKSQAPLKMPSAEFRFHPLTREFGPASGLGQYGNTIDNWGRRFFNTNRNPIMTAALSWSAWRRNPFVVIPKAHYDVGPAGGDTRVYPLVEMKSNYLSHAGTHTAACGVTAYQGDLLGPAYENSIFVCEPIGHLVTRSILQPQGSGLTAVRARPQADFLASTDTWFRPSSLATGPDGALYLADMYRLWVEHPKFLPDEIAKRLDWRAGEDRGRIWRIVPVKGEVRPFVPPETTADRVALLRDANGWRRSLGQRLLVERQERGAAAALTQILEDRTASGYARLHALRTLEGLGELTLDHLQVALNDPEAHVRRHAVEMAESWLKEYPELLERLRPRVEDDDAQVRFQLAVTLGGTDDPRAAEMLARLTQRDGGDPVFGWALLSSARDCSGAILAGLVQNPQFVAEGNAGRIRLVRELAGIAGARGDVAELSRVLKLLEASPEAGAWWQNAVLSGLATGLPRHQGALGRLTLPKLLANPPPALAGALEPIRRRLQSSRAVALQNGQPLADRVAAVELLGYQPIDDTLETFRQLLGAQQPVEVQLATLDALRVAAGARGGEVVLAAWPALGPRVRGPALDLLLSRTDSTRLALKAMAAGEVSPSVINIDGRVRLLRHQDESIRALATELLGGAVSSNRRAVADEYRAALTTPANAAAGKQVFQKICAKCHRLNGEGYEVGPDISDVRNRSREALLFDILDPNRQLEPRFTAYTVVTHEGRVFNGLMISETADAVVLRAPEGKEQIIPRGDIDELQGSGQSLMPEGIEKEVSVQQMADLLEYLRPGAEVRGQRSEDREKIRRSEDQRNREIEK